MGDPRLQGKCAVVTGGGSGLGRVLVRALIHEGAQVALSYCHSKAGAESEAHELHARGGRVVVFRADALVRGEMVRFVEEAAGALGGVDILLNNVGVFRKAPVGELTEEVLDEAFEVNVKAAVMAAQTAAPHMRRRGEGTIVNIASLGGERPWRLHLPYCASKAALIMATRCLAVALAPTIRVNAVAPGLLEEPAPPEGLERRIPLQRFGTYAEVVEAVLHLVTGARYTTGAVLHVDGGRAWAST